MRAHLLAIFSLASLAACATWFIACSDPVHDDDVAALGPENPKVPQGPLHRPGQPCDLCHGGRGPAQATFSMAGTIFATSDLTSAGAGSVAVTLTDANQKSHKETTNAAGNFYVHADEWTPTYPVHVTVADDGGTLSMQSHVGRDGSCAGCHHDPPGTETPGHVYAP